MAMLNNQMVYFESCTYKSWMVTFRLYSHFVAINGGSVGVRNAEYPNKTPRQLKKEGFLWA